MKRHRSSKLLLACLLGLTSSAAIGSFDPQNSLPDIGSSSDNILSIADEKRLGEAFMRNIRGNVRLMEDPEVEDYIQALGQRLASYLSNPPYGYTFFVVDAGEINAFAAPGGYVGINSGLIVTAETENELASVIAHEIAHVSQRHISRAFEKSQNVSLTTMASIVAAILLAGQNSDASFAALSAGMASGYQAQLNFTRAHEHEADRVGIQILADAGYEPRGMPQFFDRLHQSSRYSASGVPEILRTHPITLSRLSDALNRAEQFPARGNIDHPSFQLIRTRLIVSASSNPQQLEQDLASRISETSPARDRYGYALALIRNGAHEKAEAILQGLIQADQERIPYIIALSDSMVGQNRMADAITLLENSLKLYPGNKSLTMKHADFLLSSRQAPRAMQLLDDYLRKYRPATPNFYRLQARAADLAGKPGDSHAALAEYHYLRGATAVAIQHMEVAVKEFKDESFRLPAMSARLEELKKIALQEKNNP